MTWRVRPLPADCFSRSAIGLMARLHPSLRRITATRQALKMQADGSFFTVTFPAMIAAGPTLVARDPHQIRQVFAHHTRHAAKRGLLTPREQNSMRLLGWELSEVAPKVDNPRQLLELLPAVNFVDKHLSYTGGSRTFTTVGSVRVDDWIRADMASSIARTVGDLPGTTETKCPQRASTHRGMKQKIGWPLWKIVEKVQGKTSPQALDVWQRFNL